MEKKTPETWYCQAQLSSPSEAQAVSGRATHKCVRAHTHRQRINWDLHRAQWISTVRPRGTWHLLCPNCLCVGLWAVAQRQHVMVPPWPWGVGHLASNASPPSLLLSSAGGLIARCWHRPPAKSVYKDTTFPAVSDIVLQSLVDPWLVPRLITLSHLHYPINHSSLCSVTQPVIKAKSWCSCNIIIYKQVYK